MILAALASGIGSSFLWVAQGSYISECATEQTKGFYFGYFWAYYMASQVVGNLLGALVFDNFDLVFFYLLMGCFSATSAVIFGFLRKPVAFK